MSIFSGLRRVARRAARLNTSTFSPQRGVAPKALPVTDPKGQGWRMAAGGWS